VCDVRERATVDEGRVVFQRLHQVRHQRVFQQHRHRAFGLQVAGVDRLAVAGVTDNDPAQTLFQVFQTIGQAEDRHDFGSHRDVETGLAREAVGNTTKGDDGVTQGAVVHVQHAAPSNATLVEAKLVAPVDVVVDQSRQQVMSRRNGMEVTGEVQVDVFHRNDLSITTTSGTALNTEARTQRRFAQRDHRLLADAVQAITEANRGRRLTFTRRGRGNGGHQDQFTVRLTLQAIQVVEAHLCLARAVLHQLFGRNAQLCTDLCDRLHLCFAGNFDIGLAHYLDPTFPFGAGRFLPGLFGALNS